MLDFHNGPLNTFPGRGEPLSGQGRAAFRAGASRFPGRGKPCPYATVFTNAPIPSITIFITSPLCRVKLLSGTTQVPVIR